MATQIDSLAQVYAKSLFELAQQAGGHDKILEVGDELEQILELVRADGRFLEFMRSPIIEKGVREATINRIFGDNVTDLTLRFLLVLNAKGRLSHLEPIAAAYDQLMQRSFGRVEVDVFTPETLDDERRESIKSRIRDALDQEPVLYAYTDPAMLGGIKLRIGDQLIDASVATRLRRLREHLLSSGATALRPQLERLIRGEDGASGAPGETM